MSVKLITADELEFTSERDAPHLVCKYSKDGESLRAVLTVLGTPQAIYFRLVPEGLQRADGTILYDAAHFEVAARAAKQAAAERERQKAALVAISPTPMATPSPPPILSGPEAQRVAVSAPTPYYPYESRARHITGSGVAKLGVDPKTGSVTDTAMIQSTGNNMLDQAALSAFRRWKFKPGSTREVRMPITFTMSGVSY
jgi:TonB family protein